MSNTNRTATQVEAFEYVQKLLGEKFAVLIKAGMEPKAAFADVMGAFEQQFPGMIEKLG